MLAIKKYSTLPENADKILFAEDIVNYILRKLDLPLLFSGIADHRDRVFNAFKWKVIDAAEVTYETFEEEVEEEFQNILKENKIDHNAFLEYFKPMKLWTVHPGEIGSKNFIEICVRLSLMAGKFYLHGCEEAPALAVDYIISVIKDIDMVKERGWDELDTVAENWSFGLTDSDSEHESDSVNISNSEASRSPDPVSDGGGGQDENPEELTDDKMCIAAISSSSEEPVSSIYDSEHVEKMYDAKAGSIVNYSDNNSDSVSPGSSKEKNSDSSIHSFKGTSRKDDISKQMIELKRNRMPSWSYSKDSDSDSKRCKTDLKTAD